MTDLSISERQSIIEKAVSIAQSAGQLIMKGWRSEVHITKKSTIDLVTEYDVQSEDLIRTQLHKAFPDHAIVGEEGDKQSKGELTWYVDPIDGTTNFAHGHPYFCVSLGLVVNNKPLLGVIWAPALQILWKGGQDLGAWRNDKPCQVSRTESLQESLGATGFPYNVATTDENNFKEFMTLQRATRGIRRCGAAALDLAHTAEGTYDFFWEQTLKPWDVSAGIALVQAAGGKVTDYAGEPFIPAEHHQLVASNTKLHPQVLSALHKK